MSTLSTASSNMDETASLVTARSSSTLVTPSSSIICVVKKVPARINNEHGGAGDNVSRNTYHGQSPTSRRQATNTNRRRRRGTAPRRPKDYDTPKPLPKRQLTGNAMSGYSSFMSMPYSSSKKDALLAFDDVDVLLYTVKELCSLVDSERFVCGPTFMAQFQVLTQRVLYAARNLSHRCRQSAYSPPLLKPTLYDSLLRGRSPELRNTALSRPTREVSPPRQENFVMKDGERVLKRSKVFVPEHPNYNFIGRILGPRGISVRQLEASSGCGILIRGKGSVKNSDREERLRNRNTPGFEHLKEPLHVLITAEGDDEAECDGKLDKCKRRIEKLLKPEYDEFKRRQLAQLAMINGNYDASRGVSPGV